MKTSAIKILAVSAVLLTMASALAWQPEVLYGFPLGPGNPSSLVQGSDGSFYGTTTEGGIAGKGTVFKVTTNGVFTTLVSFTGPNGANPQASLVLGNDGNFYGTTTSGGSSISDFNPAEYGTVFKMTPSGVLTTLFSFSHSFGDTNGVYPRASLEMGHDGNFYGTTSGDSFVGIYGTVFKVTTNGVLTTLISSADITSPDPDGRSQAPLFQGSDGNFYGTTEDGGYGAGTVFKVTDNGVLTTLVSFKGNNGSLPVAGLVLGPDGNLYGTTSEGGPRVGGTIFRLVMPRFNNVVKQPDGSLLFNGVGPANEGFRVWSAPSVSLAFSSWSLVTSNAFDRNGNFSYTDAGVATNSSRFYRLSVP